MQSVNGAQFLNNTLSLALFIAAQAAALFGTVIVHLTKKYASLSSHKFDLTIDVLNLVLLLTYLPFDSSFISNQFRALNLDG